MMVRQLGTEDQTINYDAGPPATATATATATVDTPIGVEAGYAAPRYPGPGTYDWHRGPGGALSTGDVNIFGHPYVTTMFGDGAEWGPLDSPDVIGLQSRLIEAGLLSVRSVRPGVWDQSSASAYRKVLELANRYGATVNDVFSMLLANPEYSSGSGGGGHGGGGGGGRLPANEDDLKALANQVAPTIIGRRFDDAEMAQWIGSWRAVEQGNPPQADVAAESSARAQVPVEAGAHDLANTYGQFLKVIGGAG